jgi:hypothetical protein
MDLLDVLVEKGDVLSAAREVQHWMYFRSEQSRAQFRNAAVAAGFSIVSEPSSKGAAPRPHRRGPHMSRALRGGRCAALFAGIEGDRHRERRVRTGEEHRRAEKPAES